VLGAADQKLLEAGRCGFEIVGDLGRPGAERPVDLLDLWRDALGQSRARALMMPVTSVMRLSSEVTTSFAASASVLAMSMTREERASLSVWCGCRAPPGSGRAADPAWR